MLDTGRGSLERMINNEKRFVYTLSMERMGLFAFSLFLI